MSAPAPAWQADWAWWKRGVVYQVYPRSFQDHSGDGCGDLPGILARLDHLAELGVEALWISPIYPSPMKDFGYDVADYTAIHPLFGSMADFDRLLESVHARGMKLILDLVPNHTSDQHPWFLESSSSRDNPKRDWYLWADPGPDGGPPNNWVSEFAGPAWQWHEPTGQYYYHAFLVAQPDLNWRNPEVREAVYAAMRFWLDKGVDGFRVDVMWHLVKDAQLRNNPPNPDYDRARDSPYQALLPVYSTDQPEVHHVVREMRALVDGYEERVLIGEIYLPVERLVSYYGIEEKEAHLPFNFQLIGANWDAAGLRSIVDAYEASLPADGWPNWVLGNHDKPRLASRVGQAQARVAAMLLLSLRGTPTLYYGDEIGMEDVAIPPGQVVDPRELQWPGMGLGRDPARTPMQWDDSTNAGFSSATPWLPLATDWRQRNVAVQRAQAGSLYNLYRRLLALRGRHAALAVGSYAPLAAEPPLFGWLRRHGEDSFLVLLNLSATSQRCAIPGGGSGVVAASTHGPDGEGARVGPALLLRPDEGVLLQLDASPAPHTLHTRHDDLVDRHPQPGSAKAR